MRNGSESRPAYSPDLVVAPKAAPGEFQEPQRIRILIVDDHPMLRQGLRNLLQMEDDFDIVGEAQEGRQALDLAQKLDPDIMLLDLRMPQMDGLSTLQRFQLAERKTKVIVLTACEDRNEWMQAMKLGCSGIVSKQTEPELIVKSIRKVNSGEIWLDSHTTAAVVRQFAGLDSTKTNGQNGRGHSPLTAREREIVSLVAQGHKNKDMAEKLSISEQTVKNHLHNIFEKLSIKDRLELALYAIHEGTMTGTAA